MWLACSPSFSPSFPLSFSVLCAFAPATATAPAPDSSLFRLPVLNVLPSSRGLLRNVRIAQTVLDTLGTRGVRSRGEVGHPGFAYGRRVCRGGGQF